MRDGQNARPSLFFPDDAEVFFVGDEAATHGTEVGRFELTVDELAHGVADVDLLGEDDEALQGTEPQGLVLALEREPREIAIGVGEQQTIDTQVATHCYQSVGLAQMGVREPEVVVELKNHNSNLNNTNYHKLNTNFS